MKTFFKHLLIQLSILITLGVSYAAWNDVINSGDPLTAGNWNDLVTRVADLDNFSFSGENVGIGIGNPVEDIHINKNDSSGAWLKFTNATTGSDFYDGTNVGIQSDQIFRIRNFEATDIRFHTSDVERMTIDGVNGNVGIGISDPNQKLQVEGDVRIGDGGNYQDLILETSNDGFTNGGFTIKPATSPGTGVANFYTYFKNSVTSPTGGYTRHNIIVAGTAQKPGGGSWSTFSDARLKDISGDYNGGLELITQLDPKIFYYKPFNPLGWDSETQHIGFIAQDVQKIFPRAVTQGENGYLQLDTQEIDVAIINALKHLHNENEKLQKRIDILELR